MLKAQGILEVLSDNAAVSEEYGGPVAVLERFGVDGTEMKEASLRGTRMMFAKASTLDEALRIVAPDGTVDQLARLVAGAYLAGAADGVAIGRRTLAGAE